MKKRKMINSEIAFPPWFDKRLQRRAKAHLHDAEQAVHFLTDLAIEYMRRATTRKDSRLSPSRTPAPRCPETDCKAPPGYDPNRGTARRRGRTRPAPPGLG
jgi:hypothetical protein